MPILRDMFSGRAERSTRRLPSLSGTSTASSVVVTPERSLQIASVYACIRVLADAASTLPTHLGRKNGSTRTQLASHPLADLLLEEPNPQIDATEFWRSMIGWMGLRGNGYAFVERNRSGVPKALWPVSPASVSIKRAESGPLVYELRPDESAEYVPVSQGYRTKPGEMLHYRSFGLGVEGLSPIAMARQQIGISFATTSYIGGFFARDASPGGSISVAGELTDTQYNRMVEQWTGRHEGFDASHKLAVLEGGAKWEKTSLSPADAAFMEVYKLTRTEIAAIYGVPPHMIGDLERATFSNIEQQSLEFVMHSLRPWLVRLERVTRRLLGPGEYLTFDVNGLLRGDTAARFASYAQGRQWGWYSANDVRRMEDAEPIEGGDEYLVPINMLPASATPAQRAARTRAAAGIDPSARTAPAARTVQSPVEMYPTWYTRIAEVTADAFDAQRDALTKVWETRTRPGQHVRALSADTQAEWDDDLAEDLRGPISEVVTESAKASATALGGTFNPAGVRNWVKSAAQREAHNINTTTLAAIDRALAAADEDPDDDRDELTIADDVLAQRSKIDAALIALGITTAVVNFARVEGARSAGAGTKTWIVTSANPRASHAAMDGETVPLSEDFSNGMAWPGDPSGGADEVANCMCGVEFTTP